MLFSLMLGFLMALNIASWVGLVLWSKNLFLEYNFPYAYTLAAAGLFPLAVGLVLAAQLRMLKGPSIPFRRLSSVIACFVSWTVLTQVAIMVNPISTHQGVCVLAIPLIVSWVSVCEASFTSTTALRKRMNVVMACVCAAVFGFIFFHHQGMTGLFAITSGLAVLSGAAYMVSFGALRQELDCSGLWLLGAHIPYSALCVVVFVLFMDRLHSLKDIPTYICAWQTIMMATLCVVALHVTTAKLLDTLSVVTVSVLTVPAFLTIIIVADLKYGELMNGNSILFACAVILSVLVFMFVVIRTVPRRLLGEGNLRSTDGVL